MTEAVLSTTEQSPAVAAPEFGKLSDEALERSRRRLGVPQPLQRSPHNLEVSRDGSRHFAYGYGDDNPLYCEPAYGKNTRWGTLIAPPGFMYPVGDEAPPEPDAATKGLLKGDPFARLGSYQAVMEFEWYRPLVLGATCQLLLPQLAVQDKPSRFGGRAAPVAPD